MSYLTLVPAYGRDYKSQAAVKADWNCDKDFLVQDISSPYDGKYVNKKDLLDPIITKRMKIVGQSFTVNIRYKQLRNIATIKVK